MPKAKKMKQLNPKKHGFIQPLQHDVVKAQIPPKPKPKEIFEDYVDKVKDKSKKSNK
jgi:hypothetical protein